MKAPKEITLRKMAILGLGWFGIFFFWGFYSGVMPLFLRGFTDSKFKISLVLTLAGVSGCVVPPVVGYFSDRGTSRFGRRRPYIFLGMLGVFLCLLGMPHVATFGVVALLSAAMYFSVDVAQTPYMSLLPDITPPAQRGTASGVMNMLGGAGLVACFFISSRIWELGHSLVFAGVAVVSFGSVALAIILVSEPNVMEEKPVGHGNLPGYFRSLMRETNALKFFSAQFFWWLGFRVVQSFITLSWSRN